MLLGGGLPRVGDDVHAMVMDQLDRLPKRHTGAPHGCAKVARIRSRVTPVTQSIGHDVLRLGAATCRRVAVGGRLLRDRRQVVIGPIRNRLLSAVGATMVAKGIGRVAVPLLAVYTQYGSV
jgi:hypothetical protein